MRTAATLTATAMAVAAFAPPCHAEVPDVRLFFEAASRDDRQAEAALRRIAEDWREDYVPLLVDLVRLLPAPRRIREVEAEGGRAPGPSEEGRGESARFVGDPFPSGPTGVVEEPGTRIRERLVRFLERQTRQSFGHDLRRWRRWMWQRPFEPHPQYATFKATLYGQIDRRMAEFFPPGVKSLIRLDEVDWGGVTVNGIPPLDHPKQVTAREATYLKDGNVVFGVFLNGEARAYPKRIIAWHEMVRDRVGGVELTIVYCTLCGTVIPYASEVGGIRRTFGTSGLLYRSNKLMFDEQSMSLWSAASGRPVIGSLAGSGLELPAYPVVTTTWKEWVAEHPDTTVLSLATGHDRDYSEGAAYRDYFASDRLMFEVPKTDPRLKNKAEVLTLLLRPAGQAEGGRKALAVSAEFLQRNPLYTLSFAGHDLLIVTSREGANRAYETGGTRFVRRLDPARLADDEGRIWRVTEDALVPEGHEEASRPRIPAWRTFWFGWYAQFPETQLVK